MEAICLRLRHLTSQSTVNVFVASVFRMHPPQCMAEGDIHRQGWFCNYLSKWATGYCMHLLCIQYFDTTRVDSCTIIKQLFDKKELSCLHDAIAVHDLHELSGIMCGCQTVTSVWYIPWVIWYYLEGNWKTRKCGNGNRNGTRKECPKQKSGPTRVGQHD